MKPIKNIRLISPQDSVFMKYQQSFRKEEIKTVKERSKSEMISYVLELTTREWIKTTSINYEKRIISYDRYNYKTNRFNTQFEEIDFVLRKGNDLILGEVKTSYTDKLVLQKAVEQLQRKGKLLKQIGFNVKYQILFFDLCYNFTSSPLNTFSINYSKSNFSIFCNNSLNFEYLHLSPVDLFQWGVEQKIIKTPELLNAALTEAKERRLNQIKKVNFKSHLPEENIIQVGNFSNCSQGKYNKSETIPPTKDIGKVIKLLDKKIEKDTIIVARNNWMKNHAFIIPDSNKLMNLCIQIKNKSVRRAFYCETMSHLLKKLNYEIIILN